MCGSNDKAGEVPRGRPPRSFSRISGADALQFLSCAPPHPLDRARKAAGTRLSRRPGRQFIAISPDTGGSPTISQGGRANAAPANLSRQGANLGLVEARAAFKPAGRFGAFPCPLAQPHGGAEVPSHQSNRVVSALHVRASVAANLMVQPCR